MKSKKLHTFYFKDGRAPITCTFSDGPVDGHTQRGPQTTLQKLASQRNWDIVQVKGAIGNLIRVNNSRNGCETSRLHSVMNTLLTAIDHDWKEKRMCEQFKIDAAKEKADK